MSMRFALSYVQSNGITVEGSSFNLPELLREIVKLMRRHPLSVLKTIKVSVNTYSVSNIRHSIARQRAIANGEDTYEMEYSDIDICRGCGEHSSEAFDTETQESLGSACCGAGAYYID